LNKRDLLQMRRSAFNHTLELAAGRSPRPWHRQLQRRPD